MDSLTTAAVLPISGCTAVFVHQNGGRIALELLAPGGRLLTVSSDSLLDTTLVRGAWHGVRVDSRGFHRRWSLAIGHCTELAELGVRFDHRRLLIAGPTLALEPIRRGVFWIAEAEGTFTHVAARSGARTDILRLSAVRDREVRS